ncbi:DUF3656 domain-containing U32 family peptidase [Desulfotomaculum copahuensis]|uniref:Peptidase U32 n=1 Tax=Desulfotomaculum copahuensis TaxID=1838280 RepID=A0A1B7LAR1_9FIRM|nr:DUF3656 domain-containing protein [Desulfotomaculum copahuensis]OAT79383.1 peptidase U32 [Desulfotomaculum copahuensis]
MGSFTGNKPELLAPAGSKEALVAAVQNGADAVYLGGRMFNARHSAANFDDRELARAVEYAHVRGVKVHVTVNILLAEHELPEALRFLHFLQRTGVDAVIVQDTGLSVLARRVLPELPLHASTQMTIHNRPAVEKLQSLGFARVVLAREMELADIAAIKKNTGAELEVFIHGALCVCYSGQCLLSSMIGGRSGNRGRCAQPCRMRYTLVDDSGRPVADPRREGEYLLSPRDLNLSEHIPALIRAGIDSFKIEGRMKRPEYVATVIRIYRQLIDRAVSRGDYSLNPEETRDLAQIFNRDFTTGYFFGRPGYDLMSYKRPNNRGLLLGRVRRYDRAARRVELALDDPLRVGDGLEVWVSAGGRVGSEVHEIWLNGRRVDQAPAGSLVQVPFNGHIHPGDRVFKTHDAALMERAAATFTSDRETRKTPLDFYVRARVGEPVFIRVRDENGLTGEGSGETPGVPAEHRPLTEEFLRRQLDRLGNTPFSPGKLHCDIQGAVMVPAGEINSVRRAALTALEAARREAARPAPPVPEDVFASRWRQAQDEGWHPRTGRAVPEGAADMTPPVPGDALLRRRTPDMYSGRGFFDRPGSPAPEIDAGPGPGEPGGKIECTAAERKAGDKMRSGQPTPGRQKIRPLLTVVVTGMAELEAAVKSGADLVYAGGESFQSRPPVTREDILRAAASGRRKNVRFVLSTPRIVHDKELPAVYRLLDAAVEAGADGVLVGNPGLLKRARETRLSLYTDLAFNVFNLYTAGWLLASGAVQVTLSPELTMEQVAALAEKFPVEVLVHGAVELMVSRYCAPGSLLGGLADGHQCGGACRGGHYALKDRLGAVFPLEMDQFCRMHIFNSRDLCLLDDIPKLAALGVAALRIDARGRTPEYVAAVTGAYRRALDGRAGEGKLAALKDMLVQFSPAGFTKGHYYRGVL